MRVMHTRLIGGAAAVVAGVLAGVSLRPTKPAQAVAARNPAVEVRTEVIHRTIRIVRHEHPKPTRSGSTILLAQAGGARAGSHSSVAAVTRTSAHHLSTASAAAGASANPVTTRSSHHASSSGSGAKATTPVTTRTSHHSSTSGSASTGTTPVTTRTSSGATTGSKPVTTRTSSGSGGGDDGGGSGDNSGDN